MARIGSERLEFWREAAEKWWPLWAGSLAGLGFAIAVAGPGRAQRRPPLDHPPKLERSEPPKITQNPTIAGIDDSVRVTRFGKSSEDVRPESEHPISEDATRTREPAALRRTSEFAPALEGPLRVPGRADSPPPPEFGDELGRNWENRNPLPDEPPALGSSVGIGTRPTPGSPSPSQPQPQPPVPSPPPSNPEPRPGLGEERLVSGFRAVAAAASGEEVAPLDLSNALAMAGARDAEAARCRELILKAVAELERGRTLWLPSLYLGAQYLRHDGVTQNVAGDMRRVSKQSLFLGATALGSGGAGVGPNPLGGPLAGPPLGSVIRISDAIFEPMAAERRVGAATARTRVAEVDGLIGAALAHLDLVDAAGRIGIASTALREMDRLAAPAARAAELNPDLAAEARRLARERERYARERDKWRVAMETRSSELARRLGLDPRVVLAPLEPSQARWSFVPLDADETGLVGLALRERPDLRAAGFEAEESEVRARKARMGPWIPSVGVGATGGALGGGPNGDLGAFDARGNADVGLYWTLEGLGMGDLAAARAREAEQRAARIRESGIRDRIAAEVHAAFQETRAAAARANELERTLREVARDCEELLNEALEARRPLHEGREAVKELFSTWMELQDAVTAHNRGQLGVLRAIGLPPGEALFPGAPGGPSVPPPGPGSNAGAFRRLLE